jgi:hypothetical protein
MTTEHSDNSERDNSERDNSERGDHAEHPVYAEYGGNLERGDETERGDHAEHGGYAEGGGHAKRGGYGGRGDHAEDRDSDVIMRSITGPKELDLFTRFPYVLNDELADDLAAGRRLCGRRGQRARHRHQGQVLTQSTA